MAAMNTSSKRTPLVAFAIVALGAAHCSPPMAPLDASATRDSGPIEDVTDVTSVANDATQDTPNAIDDSATDASASVPDGALDGSATCDTSMLRPLVSGRLVNETSVGERGTPCGTEFGTYRFYRVVLAPGQRVSVTATGIDSYRPRIITMSRCNADRCGEVAWPVTGSMPQPAQWIHDNTTSGLEEFFLAVGDVFGGSWNLDVTIGSRPTPPSNTSCAQAIALTSGVTMRDQDLRVGGAGSPACATPDGAPVLYYRVTIPSRGNAGIVVRSRNAGVLVSVLDSCAATTCSRTESTSSFTHHNSGLRSQSFILAVSAADATRVGSFDITATVSSEITTRYQESTTPVSCDDLSSTGTPVAGLRGTFDEASPTTALPTGFAFELFGEPTTHYSVHSNALIQLFSDASAMPRVTSFGGRLGDPTEPNGLIAPLWMNLAPARAGARTRWALLGAAPNRRFVIDWDGLEFWEPMTSSVRVQAKLFETTHVVEFHYCTLTSSDERATGSYATIGLESLAGVASALHLRSSPLSPSVALRFTPTSM